MVYLGIDYGAKKVGLSISDTGGLIAFPLEQVKTDEAIERIATLVNEKKVGMLVMGDTLSAGAEENVVTKEARRFAVRLEEKTGLTVQFVPEYGTSGAARAGLGEGVARGVLQDGRKKEDKLHDARAAALILQRFLDVHRKEA